MKLEDVFKNNETVKKVGIGAGIAAIVGGIIWAAIKYWKR